MIDLANTKYGVRRKAVIGGVSFNIVFSTMQVSFYIQLLNTQGALLEDLSLRQNREVIYTLDNSTRVDNQFNIVDSGGKGEYEYFFELMQTTPLPSLIIQLGNKLKTRGLFE